MTMQQENDLQLLAVNKVSTTTSGNKPFRMRWEEAGTRMWVHFLEEGYLFSKTRKSDTEVTVKTTHAKPVFTYISARSIIKEEGYMSTFRTPEGEYFARPATGDEISRHAIHNAPLKESGHVRKRTSSITLTKADSQKLWKTPYVLFDAVMTEEKLFIEAKPVSEAEAVKHSTYIEAVSSAGGFEAVHAARDVELVYITDSSNSLHLHTGRLPVPIEFIRRAGSNENDVYKTWFREDGVMVIEAKPLYCDICGREINRYFDVANFVCICGDCKEKADGLTPANKKRMRGLSHEDYMELMARMDAIIDEMEYEMEV